MTSSSTPLDGFMNDLLESSSLRRSEAPMFLDRALTPANSLLERQRKQKQKLATIVEEDSKSSPVGDDPRSVKRHHSHPIMATQYPCFDRWAASGVSGSSFNKNHDVAIQPPPSLNRDSQHLSPFRVEVGSTDDCRWTVSRHHSDSEVLTVPKRCPESLPVFPTRLDVTFHRRRSPRSEAATKATQTKESETPKHQATPPIDQAPVRPQRKMNCVYKQSAIHDFVTEDLSHKEVNAEERSDVDGMEQRKQGFTTEDLAIDASSGGGPKKTTTCHSIASNVQRKQHENEYPLCSVWATTVPSFSDVSFAVLGLLLTFQITHIDRACGPVNTETEQYDASNGAFAVNNDVHGLFSLFSRNSSWTSASMNRTKPSLVETDLEPLETTTKCKGRTM